MVAQRIRVVGVIGAGQMGSGIAQVVAQSGYSVVLQDVSEAFLETGLRRIQQSLERLQKKGTLNEEQVKEVRGRIRNTLDLAEMKDAQIVVEAATENLNIKEEIFRRLDAVAPADTILATNTSSISITRIAAVTGRPDKVIGMHFMNPVPVMELVEVIRGLATSAETFQCVQALSKSLGKTPVEAQDFPGFIVNRILMPYLAEAMRAFEEGVGTADDIDTGARVGLNHPMGPLELADFIGLDVCLGIMRVLWDGLESEQFRPPQVLIRLVAAGHLGQKTGQGFHTYPRPDRPAVGR